MNKEAKMDWMYRDSSQVVDPEEYLLGRKVDKQFEKSSLPPDKDQGSNWLVLFLQFSFHYFILELQLSLR